MLEYAIHPVTPQAHLFQVDLLIPDPDPVGQVVTMPAWIPGSYMIRDFARQVVTLEAWDQDGPVQARKVDKQTWHFAPAAGPLKISYRVYARELSVRAAYLDVTRGYFNGSSVFLAVRGQELAPCGLTVRPPDGEPYRDWRLATTLRPEKVGASGFGRYLADDYQDLIDHPVEMGRFTRAEFAVAGTPHQVVISGVHQADLERLTRDLTPICEQHVSLFGELPVERYLFLVLAVGDGYGGLEHRSSTSLVCGRNDLPRGGETELTNGYRQLLGLGSHEYFHLWNVKRICPRVFLEQGLQQEVHTRLLWVFEGITSYYDDLALVRSGVISSESYLELLARNITRLMRTSGRFKQTLEEASFDAWTKFYKQDENAPNAIVSYYTKGSIVALALDLRIRSETNGEKSLDDVMRALWRRYGRAGRGVGEDEVEALISEVTGLHLQAFFDQALRGTDDLELGGVLEQFGVRMQVRPARSQEDQGGSIAREDESEPGVPRVLGARFPGKGQVAELTHVLEGGPAQAAGLAAGDLVVAVDGIRALPDNLEALIARTPAGQAVQVHVFRRDELMAFRVVPQPAPVDTCWLGIWQDAPEDATRRRRQWLGRD